MKNKKKIEKCVRYNAKWFRELAEGYANNPNPDWHDFEIINRKVLRLVAGDIISMSQESK
jgi:hypothetical protein